MSHAHADGIGKIGNLKKENGKPFKTYYFGREKREITERELRRKQRKGNERMSRKCPLLSAKNERQMRERRNRDETETRGKAEKEQR